VYFFGSSKFTEATRFALHLHEERDDLKLPLESLKSNLFIEIEEDNSAIRRRKT
jgi:hypothetical protein